MKVTKQQVWLDGKQYSLTSLKKFCAFQESVTYDIKPRSTLVSVFREVWHLCFGSARGSVLLLSGSVSVCLLSTSSASVWRFLFAQAPDCLCPPCCWIIPNVHSAIYHQTGVILFLIFIPIMSLEWFEFKKKLFKHSAKDAVPPRIHCGNVLENIRCA